MSQPDICWNDQHVDVLFYYLRKKSKIQPDVNYKYTTIICIFRTLINEKFNMFKMNGDGTSVFKHKDSVCHYIMGLRIPAGLPWHMVDEVYILINCRDKLHWVLAVVHLQQRCIRIYDSMSQSRAIHGEILRIAQMLPYYLTLSGFLANSDRFDWNQLDSFKGKTERDTFHIIYVDGLPQQKPESLDCSVYVAAYAEFLSNGLSIPSSIDMDQFRIKYTSLLWNYGIKKSTDGYKSDNNDPPRPRPTFNEADASNVIPIDLS